MQDEFSSDKVIDFLRSLHDYDRFVSGEIRELRFEIYNIEVIIYRESIGGMFYYTQPFDKKKLYYKVGEFMETAIPCLSKEIEKQRNKGTLSGCGNIVKSYPK